MLVWTSVAALGVVLVLSWFLYKRTVESRIEAMNERRRSTARLVSRGEYVDGNRHLKVALALTDSDLFYENADMEASLDLRWVREIEYDSRLATGQPVHGGQVLRIRCFSQSFEFVLTEEAAARWQAVLPAARSEAPAQSTLAPVVAIAS
jgi:hypothetical protein